MDTLGPQDAQVLSVLLSSLPDASVLAAPPADLAVVVRQAVKVLHDAATSAARLQQQRSLFVEGFDAEQIWVQLSSAAPQLQRSTRKLLKGLGPSAALLDADTERDIDELLKGQDDQERAASPGSSDDEDIEAPSGTDSGEALAEADGFNSDDDDDQDLPEDAVQDKPRARQKPRLPTEDDFMNLEEMEAFVNQAEADENEDQSDEEDESDEDGGDEDADALPENGDEDWSGLDDEDADADADADDDEDAMLDPGIPEPDVAGEDTLAVGNYGLDGALAAVEPAEQGGTAHERRMARMAQRVQALEAANMDDKPWYLRGEAASGARPLNSALEVDVDFERAVAPPPQPTREAMESLEAIITARIADHRFDDPPRMAAPEPEKKQRAELELDDSKSKKGLGELYEADYLHKVAGAAPEDKQQAVRDRLKASLRMLFNKLDALSHFHYAPKPVAADMGVSAPPVPALALETVGPQLVSTAGQQMPEEVLAASRAADVRLPEELNKQERKRRRAHRKAVGKKTRTDKANKNSTGNIIGRKSDQQEQAARQRSKKRSGPASAETDGKRGVKYAKSGSVFGMLQDQRNEESHPKSSRARPDKPSSAFKL